LEVEFCERRAKSVHEGQGEEGEEGEEGVCADAPQVGQGWRVRAEDEDGGGGRRGVRLLHRGHRAGLEGEVVSDEVRMELGGMEGHAHKCMARI